MKKTKPLLFVLPFLLLFFVDAPTCIAKAHRIQLVVFDYDCTITDSKTRQKLRPENEAAFKDLIQFLKQKNIHVGIATYGGSPKKPLDEMLGKKNPFHRSNILSPSRISSSWKDGSLPLDRWGYSKNTMIKKLKRHYNIRHRNEILFLDDNKEHIERAKKKGYRVYHVNPAAKGMAQIAPEIKQMLEADSAVEEETTPESTNFFYQIFSFFLVTSG